MKTLTIAQLKRRLINFDSEEFSYKSVRKFLEEKEYEHLGWLHTGISIPSCRFIEQGTTDDGSKALYVNHTYKKMYSADKAYFMDTLDYENETE